MVSTRASSGRGRFALKPAVIGVLGLLSLSGCLLDLYGGNPRLQVKNSSAFLVRSVGIGEAEDPTWKHDLDPILKSGKSSEVIELPVAGTLRLWIQLGDTTTAWDTLLIRTLDIEAGAFQLLEVSGLSPSELSTSN